MKTWEGNDGLAGRNGKGTKMKKALKWAGFHWDKPMAGTVHVGEQGGKDEGGKDDLLLDHLVLDLTGDSGAVPVKSAAANPTVQRALKRKKRLLRKTNTVLCSRLAIMALVAVMLAATTLLTWYFTSTYGARSVKSLAEVLRRQLLRTSVQTMASVLGEVYNATLILSSLHQQTYAAAANTSWTAIEPALRQVNRGIFHAQRAYSSIAFVAVDGRLTDYSRNSSGAQFFFFINQTYGGEQTWYFQNLTGDGDETNATPPAVRHYPYPLSALHLLEVKPTELYWTIAPNSLGTPVLAPAVPTRDRRTNDLLGVSTITSTFQTLNRYLASIDLLGGVLYFEMQNATGVSSILAYSYNGTKDMLVRPSDASNPVVKGAAEFLDSDYGYAERLFVNETHDEDVRINGQKYYIDTMRLTQRPYDVLNLTAVMIVPRKSIMGRIDKRNRTVVGVSVGTSLGVLLLGCIFICMVTGRMSTQMKLRQEVIRLLVGKRRAEQSSNYKSQFLANVSHELRTPMAGIIGLLDLLSCDALTSEQEFSVSQIRRCATGLLTLVNNVLDISKVEAGRMELETVTFSVAEELESLVDLFAIQSVGSNVDIVLDLSDNIPSAVCGDVTRIRQIFNNLISNSLKFTSNGHVLVRGWMDQSLLEGSKGSATDFLASTADRRWSMRSGSLFLDPEEEARLEKKIALVFEVEDSGCGIPAELREAVFGSFVQGDSSTTRVYGGSGLGLFIVRSLVELMDGEVAVVPSESGTLIRLFILVDSVPSPPARVAQGVAPAPADVNGLGSLLGQAPTVPVAAAVKQPPAEALEQAEVLVSMPDGVAKKVAVKWLERSGITRIKCVNAWEDLLSALEEMGKGPTSWNPEDGPKTGTQRAIPGFHVSKSSVHVPPVLALIDVNMNPSMDTRYREKFKGPTALESFGPSTESTASSISEEQKLPDHMQAMLASMLRIHSQHAVAVGWIVPPDCGPQWKHALQANGCFVVLTKPLHGSRMKRLLSLLARTGTLEKHHRDVHSHQVNSIFPSGREVEREPRTGKLEPHHRDVRSSHDFNSISPSEGEVGRQSRTEKLEQHHRDVHSHQLNSISPSKGEVKRGARDINSGHDGPVLPVRRSDDDEERALQSAGMEKRSKDPTTHEPDYRSQESTAGGLGDAQRGGDRPAEGHPSSDDAPGEERRDSPEPTAEAGASRAPIGLPTDRGGGSSNADNGDELLRTQVVGAEETPNGHLLDKGRPPETAQQPRQTTDPGPPEIEGTAHLRAGDAASAPNASISTAATMGNASSALRSKALSSMNILLVEDTPVLQRLANMILKRLGANVTVVANGLEAVTAVANAVEALAGSRNFDLILMDCAMPVMDGYNATKAIRAAEENTDRHIPIVALTAHALASDEEKCLSVGMDAYLTKPINCNLMVTTIQDLVSRGRAT